MDSYTPPVSVTFTACVQPVAEGYNGDRRYFVRLSLQSALNISWDKGWSGTYARFLPADFVMCCYEMAIVSLGLTT